MYNDHMYRATYSNKFVGTKGITCIKNVFETPLTRSPILVCNLPTALSAGAWWHQRREAQVLPTPERRRQELPGACQPRHTWQSGRTKLTCPISESDKQVYRSHKFSRDSQLVESQQPHTSSKAPLYRFIIRQW